MRGHILSEYSRWKIRFPDNVFCLRVGDFYEVFNDDAVKVSECLNTTLLIREGVPMTAWPWHSLSVALARLVKAGYTVAVCDPRQGSGKYEVVRVVFSGFDSVAALAAPALPEPEEGGRIFERMHRKLSEANQRLDRLIAIVEQPGQKWRPRPALRVIQGGKA